MMKTVSTEITAGLQAQVQSQSFEGVLNRMQVPADQSKQIVEAAMGKVSSNLVMTNPQPAGMQNQMAPMFYSTHLDYNILFGGGKTSDYGIGLALVGLAALAINIVIHQFKSARQTDAVKETVQQSVMV
ncbi:MULTISPECIES: hypothetical protein [unclassified Paenibacillus]|uniref:hypothetical protein n=1 Tax=unclassified Paenibacillus TaxID=185978 RepID=UPI0004A5CE6E|nr:MULTISPECIES: hypothetical protein [unclassified Paenibacillus]KGP82474.1 hypothetical protein P364_0112290 [Paenibacillus sp. MAEPY2]